MTREEAIAKLTELAQDCFHDAELYLKQGSYSAAMTSAELGLGTLRHMIRKHLTGIAAESVPPVVEEMLAAGPQEPDPDDDRDDHD